LSPSSRCLTPGRIPAPPWTSGGHLPSRVCKVALGVIVLGEAVVCTQLLGPSLGLCEMPVGHTPLDVDGRLYVALPRPPAHYLVLCYIEGLVDGSRLFGSENSPLLPVTRVSGEQYSSSTAAYSTER
jgi:hypothetical protein